MRGHNTPSTLEVSSSIRHPPLDPVHAPCGSPKDVFAIQPQLARGVQAPVPYSIVVPFGQQLHLPILPVGVGVRHERRNSMHTLREESGVWPSSPFLALCSSHNRPRATRKAIFPTGRGNDEYHE